MFDILLQNSERSNLLSAGSKNTVISQKIIIKNKIKISTFQYLLSSSLKSVPTVFFGQMSATE